MTWVISLATHLGYGILISDTCVTYSDENGKVKHKDCLRKLHWVGKSVLVGFAGSVRIGFELIDSLRKLLYIPPSEITHGSFNPHWIAYYWHQDAVKIFKNATVEDQQSGCNLLMVCIHPQETYGSFREPKIYTIKMESPLFIPKLDSNLNIIHSIGSGNYIETYKTLIEKLTPSESWHPLMQSEVGRIGGFASMIGVQLSMEVGKYPSDGISFHFHVGVISSEGFEIVTPVQYSVQNGKVVKRDFPVVASSWEELIALLNYQDTTSIIG